MITHLLDTDVCVHALKRRNRDLLHKLAGHDGALALSEVTMFELYYGAEKYDDPAKRVAQFETFTSRLEIVSFSRDVARHAGNIRHVLESTGKLIGAYDILIAATARARGLILATGNVREFSRVDGLRVEKWA